MEKISNFRDRLIQLIESSGQSQVEVAERAGISKSLLNKYIKGANKAGNDRILMLSEAFGVNPVWLMGFDVDKYKWPEQTAISSEKDQLIRQILDICNKSNESTLKIILRLVLAIANEK